MAHNNEKTLFRYGGSADQTDGLANHFFQFIDIYHVPTKQSLRFKAYLTAFTDQYSSEWNSESVYGRMDPIQTFKNTNRKISLGWDVPAASFLEAKDNLRKASLLVSMLYPTYEGDNTGRKGASLIAAPPLFKLKFMNLIQETQANPASAGSAADSGLLGTMSGFTYEPDLESGFFQPTEQGELEVEHAGNTVVVPVDLFRIFPQTIKFQAEFTVLHQHRPGWSAEGLQDSRFQKFPYSSDHSNVGTMQTNLDTTRPASRQSSLGGTQANLGGASPNQRANGANRAALERQNARAESILTCNPKLQSCAK